LLNFFSMCVKIQRKKRCMVGDADVAAKSTFWFV